MWPFRPSGLPGWDVAISDDGGKSFRRSGSEFVHVDHHAFAIHPDDPALIANGNDGGIYVSFDRAKTWEHRDNLAVGQFYRVSVDSSDPYRIAGRLQDNGSWVGPSETIYRTDDESKDGILNRDWSEIWGWDGFTVAFDPEDTDQLYATGQGAVLFRVNRRTGQVKYLQPAPREGQERFRFNWNSLYFVSPHYPTVLYLGGDALYALSPAGRVLVRLPLPGQQMQASPAGVCTPTASVPSASSSDRDRSCLGCRGRNAWSHSAVDRPRGRCVPQVAP